MQTIRPSGGDHASRSLFSVARRNRPTNQTQQGALCRQSSGSDVNSGILISVLIASKFPATRTHSAGRRGNALMSRASSPNCRERRATRMTGPSGGGRSCSCRGSSFHVSLEYSQHSCLHDPDNRGVEPVVEEASKPSRAEGLIPADNEAGAPARQFSQQESP
jgi:hypothetical protein